MAWTDQCRFEAVSLIERKKEEVGSVRAACDVVAAESDIPSSTLRHWYKYPEGKPQAGEESPGKTPLSEQEGRPQGPGPTPQSVVWSNVERRLALLRKYMDKNCLFPADMDPLVREQIYEHVDLLNRWRDEDETAHGQG